MRIAPLYITGLCAPGVRVTVANWLTCCNRGRCWVWTGKRNRNRRRRWHGSRPTRQLPCLSSITCVAHCSLCSQCTLVDALVHTCRTCHVEVVVARNCCVSSILPDGTWVDSWDAELVEAAPVSCKRRRRDCDVSTLNIPLDEISLVQGILIPPKDCITCWELTRQEDWHACVDLASAVRQVRNLHKLCCSGVIRDVEGAIADMPERGVGRPKLNLHVLSCGIAGSRDAWVRRGVATCNWATKRVVLIGSTTPWHWHGEFPMCPTHGCRRGCHQHKELQRTLHGCVLAT